MEIQIDCLGDICPVPMVRLRSSEQKLTNGDTIKLVCDHSCVVSSITDYCSKKHFSIRIDEPINGVWEIFISKP